MPRLGSMIVDGLAFVLVAIALAAVVVGYARNLPDPVVSASRVAERTPTWADPDTTGSITPKVPGTAYRWADANPQFPAAEAERPSRGGGVWVSPPRR